MILQKMLPLTKNCQSETFIYRVNCEIFNFRSTTYILNHITNVQSVRVKELK